MGNPAADRSVNAYLTNVRGEQLFAYVTPRQAEPVFLSDLQTLSDHIKSKLGEACRLDPSQIFMLARDQAIFKILFFSCSR